MKHLLFFFSFILTLSAFGQVEETVDVLTQRLMPSVALKTTATDDTIQLPIIDEFTSQSTYPNSEIWVDNYVFINTTQADNPLSIGVATFDGLNENGYPYNFTSPTAFGQADYLTSKPIFLNLNSSGNPALLSDSLYLSFYYQAEGLGDKPEAADSLVVQFWSPNDNQWFSVWNTPGESLDTNYKQVMIPILDAKYLEPGFKFRFTNYATLSGSFDHWHIDYVYLTSFRSYNDTVRDDVAFQYPLRTLLKEYTSMPWKHYKMDPTNYMLDSVIVKQRN